MISLGRPDRANLPEAAFITTMNSPTGFQTRFLFQLARSLIFHLTLITQIYTFIYMYEEGVLAMSLIEEF